MKRILSLVLAAIMLLCCFTGCGNNTEEALSKLSNYISENGSKNSAGTLTSLDLGTDLKDTTIAICLVDDAIMLMVDYSGLSVDAADVDASCVTNLYLSGEDKGEFTQQNDIEYSNSTITSKLTGNIDIASYTLSSEIDGEFSSTLSTSKLTDDFKAYVIDGINTGLEVLSDFLADSLNLTLSDIGFSEYEIDSSRKSAIRENNEKPAEAEPEPAPVTISIEKLSYNSAGTPQLTLRLTNTSDKTIEALNMYVVCYNAYGELIQQYGNEYGDNAANLEFAFGLAPGATSDSLTWSLYGFDTVKSIQIAVGYYKLEGNDKVILGTNFNDSNLVWVKYPE